MKKFTRILALMLVATMLCVLFASCGATPASDPADAKAALEENGYEVLLLDNELVLAGAALTYGGEVTATLAATNGDEYINVVWFEDEEDATDYYEKWDKMYEEAKAELDEIEDEDEKAEFEEELDNAAYGQSGTMVWIGTKNAVKAAS